jgi:hypothetical protein
MSVALASGLASASVLCLPKPARAESKFTLAAEVGGQVVVTDVESAPVETAGFGAAARAGYTMGGAIIRLTPEAKLGFESPGTPSAFSIMGGARLNLLVGLSPAVFAHAGGLVGDMDGFVWDVGGGLDLTLLPVFDLGVFVSYSQLADANVSFDSVSFQSQNWEWMTFGAQAALHF